MTAIAALVHDGVVWMGADSAAASEIEVIIRKDPKVVRRDGMLIGYAGNQRVGQLAQYGQPLPNPSRRRSGDDPLVWMIRSFVPALRALLGEEAVGNFWLLVGFEGRLFAVDNQFQIEEARDPVAAIGDGAPVALGAFHATPATMDPAKRVLLALEAAECYTTNVRGPFHLAFLHPPSTVLPKPFTDAREDAARRLDEDRETWCDEGGPR